MPPKLNLVNDESNGSDNLVSKTIIVSEGDSLTLQCPIDGNPKPDVRWMELNNRDKMERLETDLELVIISQ